MEKIHVLKKVLRAILISEHGQGMLLRILERKYRESEGTSIPLFGYPDTAALLNSLTDTVSMQLQQGQLMIFPVVNDNTKHVSDLVAKTSIPRRRRPCQSNRSPQNVQTNVWSGNAKKHNQNGYSNRAPNCQSSYQHGRGKYHPKNDSYSTARHERHEQSSGLNGIETMTSMTNLRESFHSQQKQSYSSKPTKMTDNQKTVHAPETTSKSSLMDESENDSSAEKIDIGIFMLQFDEETILLDDLPALEINDVFKCNQSFRIFISEVHSPYKFWFQLKENEELIDSLMEHLDLFYHRDESKIAKTSIPDEYFRIGMICAAKFNAEWHRARIVDVFDQSVKVFYVDFGTVSEIYKEQVRFLAKQFALHPAFAIRGCLDRVRPNNGIWTFEAMEQFNDHIQDFAEAALLAKVTNLNLTEATLYLDLIDTRGTFDSSIANWLVENNFAYLTNKKLFDFVKRHYNEVYPPFNKLENGTYPSLQQITEMMANNFDYLDYETSIIIPEMYGYETIE